MSLRGMSRMIICPGCKAENRDGVEVCPYCGTSLAAVERSSTAAAGAGSGWQTQQGTATTTNVSGSQSVSGQSRHELSDLVTKVEQVVEKVLPPPQDTGKTPNTTRRTLLAALGVLATGGVSGFGGFRVGVNRHADPTQSLRELETKLQQQQTANQNLNTAIGELNRQLANKQTQVDAVIKKQSASSGQVAHLQSSLQDYEQKLKKSQNEMTALQQQLSVERHRTRFGMIEWNGSVDKKEESLLVEVKNGQVKKGSLHGALPGVACTVLPGDPAVTIVESPSQASPNHLTFRIIGKGKMSVRLFWAVS
jgi:uncharacterized coiled-coil protein SlyX